MANTYLSYEGLVYYDGKIKTYIGDKATEVSAVTISTATTTDGYAKSYTITQNGSEIGVIDIPKDMVVSSGTVEVDPEGQAAGTYLVLTLANATNDTIYIDVGDLVDVYTAETGATQVQLSITADNVISASIVAGSITATEIADGTITLAKLATSVQVSLALADSAIQADDLGTAAYTDSTAYDAAGAAAAVLGTSADTAGTATVYGALASASAAQTTADSAASAAATAQSTADDAATAAATAQTTADNAATAQSAAESVLGTSEDTSSDYTVYGAFAAIDEVVANGVTAISNDEIDSLFA